MITRQLLLLGIDVNFPDLYCGPAICIAAGNRHDSLLQLLVEAGANIEADGPANHVLPLWHAVRHKHITSVQALLEHL